MADRKNKLGLSVPIRTGFGAVDQSRSERIAVEASRQTSDLLSLVNKDSFPSSFGLRLSAQSKRKVRLQCLCKRSGQKWPSLKKFVRFYPQMLLA